MLSLAAEPSELIWNISQNYSTIYSCYSSAVRGISSSGSSCFSSSSGSSSLQSASITLPIRAETTFSLSPPLLLMNVFSSWPYFDALFFFLAFSSSIRLYFSSSVSTFFISASCFSFSRSAFMRTDYSFFQASRSELALIMKNSSRYLLMRSASFVIS